jgi:hypothetical protein
VPAFCKPGDRRAAQAYERPSIKLVPAVPSKRLRVRAGSRGGLQECVPGWAAPQQCQQASVRRFQLAAFFLQGAEQVQRLARALP